MYKKLKPKVIRKFAKYYYPFLRFVVETLPFLKRLEWVDQMDESRSKRLRYKFIRTILPRRGIGAELGVYKGHLSKSLLERTNARKLHLIDTWYLGQFEWRWAGGNKSTIDALCKLLKKYRDEIRDGRVVVHVEDDVSVMRKFPNRYFDWVYLDSSYDYDQVKEKLNTVVPKMKVEGIIAGNHWNPWPESIHFGVYEAVTEFVNNNKVELSLIYKNEDDKQWAIKRVK